VQDRRARSVFRNHRCMDDGRIGDLTGGFILAEGRWLRPSSKFYRDFGMLPGELPAVRRFGDGE
jgi:hypothetical protein